MRSAASARSNCPSSSPARASRLDASQPAQPADHDQVLAAGQQLVEGGVLCGHADAALHRGGLADHVVAGDACRAGVGQRQRGEDPHRGGLARAVGAEHAQDRPAGTSRSRPARATRRRRSAWPGRAASIIGSSVISSLPVVKLVTVRTIGGLLAGRQVNFGHGEPTAECSRTRGQAAGPAARRASASWTSRSSCSTSRGTRRRHCARSPSGWASPRPRSTTTSSARRTSCSRSTCGCTPGPRHARAARRRRSERGDRGAWPELLNQFIDQVLAQPGDVHAPRTQPQRLRDAGAQRRHQAAHEDLEGQLRAVLANPDIPLAQRVRMACSIGAVLSTLIGPGEAFGEVPSDELATLLRDAMRDLLGPPPRV